MLKKIFTFLLLAVASNCVFAQSDVDSVKQADAMYAAGNKLQALSLYLSAANLNPENAKAHLMAGKCYLETSKKGKSVELLEKAYKLDAKISRDILYLIGKGYQLDAKFDKAIENFNAYKASLEESKDKKKPQRIQKAEKHIAECENAKTLYAQKANVNLINLGEMINSSHAEYAPVLSADESTLYFTSRREGSTGNKKDADKEYFEDIYVAKKDSSGKWGRPENIGTDINTNFHDACNGLSPDGKELYITCETHKGDIFKSTQNSDGSWSKPQKMELINSKYDEASIAFSGDGKLMMFSSDRPGGLGKLDLYYCTKDENGVWSSPQNASYILNTEYDEDSPFLDHEGKTLFFSSAGFNTMGGYDIFKSTFEDGKWTAPVNLGYPINTTDDDIYYVESSDGQRGYYASVREDGFGEKDLYMVSKVKPDQKSPADSMTTATADTVSKVEIDSLAQSNNEASKNFKPVTIKGRVFDNESGKPVEAKITLYDENGKKIQTVETSADGYYSFVLKDKKHGTYTIETHPVGFVKKSIELDITPTDEETEDVEDFALEKYVAGKDYILHYVYFDFDKYTLKSESREELMRLKDLLTSKPKMRIEIGGHTDFIGSSEFNLALSQKRAQAVVNFLIQQGISPKRLKAIGYGKSRPLATNDDEEEGRELNRRTEFKIK
jgi:outer membrane protein OmpA-like peptidoglycan-associated protein/tetratricopeptide (TPR) repeat protein